MEDGRSDSGKRVGLVLEAASAYIATRIVAGPREEEPDRL